MKLSKDDVSKKKCPLCGAGLMPVQQAGKIVYICTCGGISRTVIEVLPEKQIEGEQNDSSN